VVAHYPEVIDNLIKQGKLVGSRVDFARASVGVTVKAGAPKPDIGIVRVASSGMRRLPGWGGRIRTSAFRI
jgi:hypothetical protein